MRVPFICADCGVEAERDTLTPRRTKKYCDDCLRRHKRERSGPSKHREGACPDCGARSSMPGRRCDPCGRVLAGASKTRNAERRGEREKKTALAVLRDWGRRHGGIGPTMARWDEEEFVIPAHRVRHLFNGWLNAMDAAGLEHPVPAPRGRDQRGRYDRTRNMVTGGVTGAKRFSEAPRFDRSKPYV